METPTDVGAGKACGSSEEQSTSMSLVPYNVNDVSKDNDNLTDSGPANSKMTIDFRLEDFKDSVIALKTAFADQVRDLSEYMEGRRRATQYALGSCERGAYNQKSKDTTRPPSSSYLPDSSRETSLKPRHVIVWGCPNPSSYCRLDFTRSVARRVARTKIIPIRTKQERESFVKQCDERRLRTAAASNNVEQVKRLLEKNVNPNAADGQLRTPLHLSSGRGYTEVVRLLLDFGADPSLKDCIGNTPLHLAAVTSKISVVTLLLNAGCDPLSADLHGYNPLQLAETKLRLLQNCKGDDMLKIKSEVHEVVNMLVAFLKNRNGFGDQVDALSTFCSRLSLSSTSNEVQDEVRDLLSNIDALSLKS